MVRVLIVDDQALARRGFRMILDAEPDLTVVGEAATGLEAVEEADRLRPDVVLMDIRMPGLDGDEATRRITAAGPAPRVVVLTTFDLDEHVVESIRAGASGFLLKDVPPEDLVRAIKVVAEGEALLVFSVTRRVLARVAATPSPSSKGAAALATLTDRETEVLKLLARGLSNAVTNPYTDAKLNTSTYDQGAPPRAAGQMALDKATADRLKVGLGDHLGLATPKGNVELTVAGIFTFGSSNSLAGATLIEMHTAQVQELFDRVGLYDQIDIRGDEGLTQEQLRDRIASVLPATAQADTAADDAAEQSKSVGEFVGRRAVAGGAVTLAGAALFGVGLTSGPALLIGVGAVVLFVGLALLLAVAARPLANVIGLPFTKTGAAGDLGVANAKRNPRRTASTASALMIGLALIGGVSTFAASSIASSPS